MDRTKPVQEGVRVKLRSGVTWAQLANMTADEIRNKNLFPGGFLPLPHANHPEGGMVFPNFEIQELLKQEQRDLTRFDLEFDLPEHFLPEFPPAIYLTTRPDLGDVSKGQLVTIANFYDLFNGILNPKQIEGLRLLLTPFPQQQFNQTDDRRSEKPSRGVTCLDCHANGGSNEFSPCFSFSYWLLPVIVLPLASRDTSKRFRPRAVSPLFREKLRRRFMWMPAITRAWYGRPTI